MDNENSVNEFDKPIDDLTCRVCLNVEELMVNIYDEVEDLQSNLVELLETCGGLLIDRFDGLPKFLCNVCTEELLVAAKFREKCTRSNELLSRVAVKEVSYDVPFPVDTNETEVEETEPYPTITEEIIDEIIVVDPNEGEVKYEWNEVTENQILVIGSSVENTKHENPVEEEKPKEPLSEVPNNSELCHEEESSVISVDFDEAFYYVVDSDSPRFARLEKAKPKKSALAKTKTARKIRKPAPLAYACDECGAAFSNHENLGRHFLRTHEEFKGEFYICHNCNHPFSKKESLDNHTQCREVSEPPNTQQCSLCNKKFASEAGLKAHMRLHTEDRPYQCKECSKTFKTQVAIGLHMKRHTGQYDFECKFCGKLFVESSNLKVHMRTHTGEKPHLCKVCGKRFSRVFLLQLHMRTHTGEKPYQCNQCSKAYSQKGDLLIHSRTHTGLRPYTCQICFKSFVRNNALQKHLQQHQLLKED